MGGQGLKGGEGGMANKQVKKTVSGKPRAVPAGKPRSVAVRPVAKKSAPKVATKIKRVTKPVAKAVIPAVPADAAPVKAKGKCPFDAKTLKQVRDMLIRMRERLTGQISTLADDSLKYKDDGSSEDRTDDFDREFALNLVSSEHDAIFEIDGALRRIEEGFYGRCDACGCAIEKARLQALPFARMCVRCQSDAEKGSTRFRPLGDTLAQGVEQTPEVVETEEAE